MTTQVDLAEHFIEFTGYQASGKPQSVFLLDHLLLEFRSISNCQLTTQPYYRLVKHELETTTVHSIDLDLFPIFKRWAEETYPGLFINFKKKINTHATWKISKIQIEGVIPDELLAAISLKYY